MAPENQLDWDVIAQDEACLNEILDQIATWVVNMARHHIGNGTPVPDAINAALAEVSYTLKAHGATDCAMTKMIDPFLPAKEYLATLLSGTERTRANAAITNGPAQIIWRMMEGGRV